MQPDGRTMWAPAHPQGGGRRIGLTADYRRTRNGSLRRGRSEISRGSPGSPSKASRLPGTRRSDLSAWGRREKDGSNDDGPVWQFLINIGETDFLGGCFSEVQSPCRRQPMSASATERRPTASCTSGLFKARAKYSGFRGIERHKGPTGNRVAATHSLPEQLTGAGGARRLRANSQL